MPLPPLVALPACESLLRKVEPLLAVRDFERDGPGRAAVSAYGRRERVLSVKDAIPLANSAAGFQAAANALYDVAATFLERAAAPLESYQVAVTGLRHLDATGAPRFELGETVRVVYRGIVEDETGARAWRSIDANLYLMAFRRRFDASGADACPVRPAGKAQTRRRPVQPAGPQVGLTVRSRASNARQ